MRQEQILESCVIVDENSLRRAALTSFFRPWAERHRMAITTTCVESAPEMLEMQAAVGLILVSLGYGKVSDPQWRLCLRAISSSASVAAGARVVILSDHDDVQDVVTAFENGAQGFVPTCTEPELVMQALTFIHSGGSFFPLSVLSSLGAEAAPVTPLRCGGEAAPVRLIAPEDMSDACDEDAAIGEVCLRGGSVEALTASQERVLRLLCTGLSNKMIARELDMTEATVKVHVRHVMRKLGASNRTEAALLATARQTTPSDECLSENVPRHAGECAAKLSRISIRVRGKGM